jgi:hypothetical protein
VGKVTITPEAFTLVLFEVDRIRDRAAEIAATAGLDGDVHLEVDETNPLARLRVISWEPIELFAQGGAFEDSRRLRHLSDRNLSESLGRLLFRVKDRLDPGFADAPEDEKLSLAQQNVWDVYCLGRLAAAGYDVAKPRWHYHFRLRHGFTDLSDAAFERVWMSDGLSWADLDAVCMETERARTAG